MSKAMFGAGCFWGVEYNFAKLKGVREVLSGYSGGKTPNPTYEQVCSNSTEHAEVVMIDYDETQISYEELLDAFWIRPGPSLPWDISNPLPRPKIILLSGTRTL